MSDDAREAALAHFGVKGMKWGVRKARANTPGISRRDVRKELRDERRDHRQQERDNKKYGSYPRTPEGLQKKKLADKAQKQALQSEIAKRIIEKGQEQVDKDKARSRRKLGLEVGLAVVAASGGIAVSTVTGPLGGAATAAAIRGVGSEAINRYA